MHVLLTSGSEDEAARHSRNERQDQVGQVMLRLSAPALPPRHSVRNLVSHRTAKDVDQSRGREEGKHGQTSPLELPALGEEGERRDLLSGLVDDNHGTVGQHAPDDGREVSGSEGIEHGLGSALELEAVLEDTDVGPDGARRVVDVIELGAVLARQKRNGILTTCDRLAVFE